MKKPSSSALWRERLASPLTWHYVGAGILLLLVIGLSVRVGMDWAATNGRSIARPGQACGRGAVANAGLL
jgi:hypothetical protein